MSKIITEGKLYQKRQEAKEKNLTRNRHLAAHILDEETKILAAEKSLTYRKANEIIRIKHKQLVNCSEYGYALPTKGPDADIARKYFAESQSRIY